MIDTHSKLAFWGAVEDCLIKFHQKSSSLAQSLAWEFREDVEQGTFPSGDMVYHEEPFDLACAIAGTPEDDVDQLFNQSYSVYQIILKNRGW